MSANTEKRQSTEQPLSFHPDEEKTLWQMSQWTLTFCPNAARAPAFQQEQLQLAVYPMCNLGRWTCYFPSLLLNMSRPTGAWSCFWEPLPRLALPWLDAGMSQSATDASRDAVSQPQLNQRSAMLVCTWRKAPYGVWMASQHSPSHPGVEPKARRCWWGGGWSAGQGECDREAPLPCLCSLGQHPQILAPLRLF